MKLPTFALLGGVYIMLGISICFLLSMCSISAVKLLSTVSGDSTFKSSRYKYFHFDRKTSETTIGMVEMPLRLDDSEFVSQETSSGYTLISSAGSEEYGCSGSCYCDNGHGNEKRSIAVGEATIGRGIFFLVAAVTSKVVYQQARQYLQSECQQVLSDSCSQGSIETEIESCENMSKRNRKKVEFNDDEFARYWCSGRCRTQKFKRIEPREMSMEFGCDKLYVDGQVSVDSASKKAMYRAAVKRFVKTYLVPYCKSKSKWKYYYYNEKQGHWVSVSLCSAGSEHLWVEDNALCVFQGLFRRGHGKIPTDELMDDF